MTAEDIDATKAPLMDHLIELRMRLVRAIYAFMAAFLVCFYFSRTIYNVLTQPYVRVVGAEKATLIATHFLEQPASSPSRSSPCRSTNSSPPASTRRSARRFYPI
jgi:hypothetical protein